MVKYCISLRKIIEIWQIYGKIIVWEKKIIIKKEKKTA